MNDSPVAPNTVAGHAEVPTANASRYMIQLCKHFQHKTPASYEGDHGRIEFPSLGVCTMSAEPERLLLTAEAATDEQRARLQNVIGSHLVRFAFREEMTITWQ